MTQIDHVALGHLVPLCEFVRDTRARARDADWGGDPDTARRLDREADEAIKTGAELVPMF